MTETDNLREKTLEVHERLGKAYGMPEWRPELDPDPVGALVNTILSQNTNDRNRDVAYNRLLKQFPTWEAVRDAPVGQIIDAVRPAGLAPTKGPRVQEALRAITEHQGEISLAFLRDKPLEEARRWLLALDGVGPKTAAIVLLFSMGRPAFPVDTHVHRVTKRLGLIPSSTSREKAHVLLEDLVPESLYYPFHLNLIHHGRSVCVARTPKCEACVLRDVCVTYATEFEEST
ncbi:MAG: endonuclease III [Anaerolineae bacterium]|nr:endonuclease III [Anaerolineae bacterium]